MVLVFSVLPSTYSVIYSEKKCSLFWKASITCLKFLGTCFHLPLIVKRCLGMRLLEDKKRNIFCKHFLQILQFLQIFCELSKGCFRVSFKCQGLPERNFYSSTEICKKSKKILDFFIKFLPNVILKLEQ